MVDSSRRRKVVHGGVVLVAATGRLVGDRGRRYTVARQRQNKAAQRGRWVGGRKAVDGGGGWAPFTASIGSGRRRRGGKSRGGEMAAGNQRHRWCRGSDGLPAVCVSERQLSGRWARAILTGWAGTVDTGWVQSGAIFFPIIQTLLQF
jgi:hypothetical protein